MQCNLPGPKTPPPTTNQAPSDLLTALSMSYGGGHPRKKETQGEDKRDQVCYNRGDLVFLRCFDAFTHTMRQLVHFMTTSIAPKS